MVVKFKNLIIELQDNEKILIKKKISKLGGQNTIVRIDYDRKAIDREEKVKRRDNLVKMLNSDTIEYDGETYMVISTISIADLKPIADLNSPGKKNLLFTKLVRDMLLYFVAIESIIQCWIYGRNYSELEVVDESKPGDELI